MTPRRQTSVRITPRAIESLAAIATRLGMSRDRTVRWLLDEYVRVQEARSEEQRLTHISTVLRFPPPAIGRGYPDGRGRLAFRLEEGVSERASQLALRLPGQAPRQGHRDYGARLLTDALLTAIAMDSPYAEDGIEDLPVLLTQRQALGLWRLTVAATLSNAEEQLLFSHPETDAAIALREEGVAWHSPWRSEVALHLARRLLAGRDAADNLIMLSDQGTAFEAKQHDLERHTDLDGPLLSGLPAPTTNYEGRGGGAVWRAQRRVAMTQIARWVETGSSTPLTLDPTGWTLKATAAWKGFVVEHGDVLPPRCRADLRAGRVLRVEVGSRSVLWPYLARHVPVPGFDVVVTAAAHVEAEAVIEAVVLTYDEMELPGPRVPAVVAHELGFISAAERDELVAEANLKNDHAIEDALERARRLPAAQQDALRAAANSPRGFARLARRFRITYRLAVPSWTWQIDSIAAAVIAEEAPERLRWLVGATLDIRQYSLERDMERAWHKAFWLGPGTPDEGV